MDHMLSNHSSVTHHGHLVLCFDSYEYYSCELLHTSFHGDLCFHLPWVNECHCQATHTDSMCNRSGNRQAVFHRSCTILPSHQHCKRLPSPHILASPCHRLSFGLQPSWWVWSGISLWFLLAFPDAERCQTSSHVLTGRPYALRGEHVYSSPLPVSLRGCLVFGRCSAHVSSWVASLLIIGL